jgi:hypothetical protein
VEVWYLDLEILDLSSVVGNLVGDHVEDFQRVLKWAGLIAWSSLVWQSRTLEY